MRALLLTSDWKWTGPADPMLVLGRALRSRGHSVFVGCPEAPESGARGVAAVARERGLAPAYRLSPGRGVRLGRDGAEARRLRRWLDENDIGIVHTWHSRDHWLALAASERRRRMGRTGLVRSWPSADPIPATLVNRFVFGRGTDALLCVSPDSAERCAELRAGRPLLGCLGAVERERFETATPLRAELGLADHAPVIGVVARAQRHRRFEVLWQALASVAKTHPQVRLLLLGRGSRIEEIVREPLRASGLEERVVLAGYRAEDYPAVLRCVDWLTYLVPGSDGSCRAVLEAAACGIPVVATRRGALPEIVVDNETGILCDEDPRSLAEAWRRLIDDRGESARISVAARRRAREVFDPDRLAADVGGLYEEALEDRVNRSSPSRTTGG